VEYKTEILKNEPIIFDGSEEHVNPPQGLGKGFSGRNFQDYPMNCIGKESSCPIVPRDDWDAIISSMEKGKTFPSQYAKRLKLECINQGDTNFSWAAAAVYCVMFSRATHGLRNKALSTASVGSTVKHFENEPGCIIQAVEHICQFGIHSQDNWPQDKIDMSYDVQSSSNESKSNRVTEWYELYPGNFDQLMSHLLHRIPVAVGYNWWSHAVVAVDPISLGGGEYGIRVRNSWGNNYGNEGYLILTEKKASPDEAMAVATPVTPFI